MKQHHKSIAAGTAVCAITLLSVLTAATSHALPQDGAVVGGSATISQPSPTTMNINQTSGTAIINWSGYNIGANESVKYIQPGSSSIALNRVTGVDPSYIYGLLSGNGQVWVINPNGLLVGPGATVQTGSFLASTMNITNENFLSGKHLFTNTPGSQGSIVNQGNISAANGGYVVLAAPSVTNSGKIVANMGTVHLASGDAVTLSLDNGSLINVAVNGDVAANALGVTNSGRITADGGKVVMTARVAGDIMKNIVNNSGIIEAKSIVEKNGEIMLDGGDYGISANSGTLDASGKKNGETGGTIKILGDRVGLFAGSTIDVSGDAGGGTALIGGNFHGAGTEKNASMTYVDKDAAIKADALVSGDGGKVAVWSDDATRFYGAISAQGGTLGGDGGFAEVSGKQNLTYAGNINLGATKGTTGTLLLDPDDITIIHADDASSDTADNIAVTPPFIDWDSTEAPSAISDFTINTQLSTPANVTVQTSTGSISSNPDVIIDINSKTLTLDSAKDITLGGTYNDIGASGTLALKIGQAGSGGTLTTIPDAATINAHTVDVTGGSGTDTVDVSGLGGAVSIHDTVGGDTLTGNGTHTTLIGSNTGSAFTLSGSNAGTLNGSTTFSGITTLTGGSNADTFTLGAGTTSFNGSIAGGGGTDTLAATDGTNSWQVTGSNAGTLNGTTTFSGITNLAGGVGADAFTLDVPAFSGSIAGGGGADSLVAANGINSWRVTGTNAGTLNSTTTFSGITNLAGGSVADTFSLDADVPTFSGSIAGGGGTDTLRATNGTNTWQTTGTNSGTLNGSTLFSGITNLAGGSGADTTTLGASAFSGSITGGGGTDTLAAGNGTNMWQTTGTNSGTLNGSTIFSGITNLAGGSGADTLTGRNVTNGWSITGTKAATLDGMNGTGMDALVGGSGADTFRLGTGISTFNGSITGGGGSDTLAATNGTNSWLATGANAGTMNGTTSFSGITNLRGGSGADTFRLGADLPAFSGGVTGGGGSDKLAATNGTNSWQVTGANAGTLNGSTLFSGITTLAGGTDTDTLTGQNSANTTGWSITGANAAALSGMNTTGMDALAGGTGKDIFTLAEGVSTFNGQITGGGSDTLAATAGTNNWQVTGANAGTLNGTTTFSGITSLSGGTGADTFKLGEDIPTLNGSITGGGGSDTLIATNLANSWQVTGANAGTLNGTTIFSGITNLSGGADTDTLTGLNTANDWRITGPAAAAVDGMNANGMNSLVGGSGADTFTLGTGVSTFAGPISGGGGSDTLAATNGPNSWQVTGANGGTLNGSTLFSGITNLTGGSDADTFTLGTGISSFNGLIAGGGGTDTLAMTDGINSWRRSGANAGTLNTTTVFSGITNLSGGTGTDTLTGTAQTYSLDDITVNQGSNGSEIWTSMESLTDTAAGVFKFGTAGGLSGNIAALGGTLDYTGRTTAVNTNLADNTGTGIGGTWNGIRAVTGSSNNDTISGTSQTYNLTEPNAGNSGGVSWTSFEKIADSGTGTIATTGGQTYNLTGANRGNVMTLLPGGYNGIGTLHDSGSANFRFGAGGAVSDGISATGGTLDYSAGIAGPVAVNLTAKSGSGIGSAWDGITTVTGSGASDTMGSGNATYNLTAADTGNSGGVSWTSFEKIADTGTGTISTSGGQTYNLTGANSGNVATLLPGGYTGIGTLNDSGAANFRFAAGGSVTGGITAVGGALDYSAGIAGPVAVDLTTKSGTGIGTTWNGITTMTGSGASDTLGGANTTYHLTGADAGDSGAVSWTSFENLLDTAAGIYTFADAGGVSGGVTATGGTLDYSAMTVPVTVDLTAQTGPGIGATWNGITTVNGSANSSDIITGSGQTYNLTGVDTGNNGSTSWSSFENIAGTGSNSYNGAGGSTLSGAISNTADAVTLQGAIQTGGGQSYAGPVTLVDATNLTSTGSGDITFAGTVASDATPRDLTVGTAGDITFAGAVGTAPLNSLTVNSGGTTYINGGSVTTSGAAGQTYNNAVLLGGDTLLNAGPGAIAEGSSGSMTADGLLTTRSGSGQNLVGNGTNSVAAFNAANTTSGDINLTNGSPLLTITGINQSGGGVTITNSGAITSTGPLAVSGATSISAAGQPITLTNSENDFGGVVTVSGATTRITDKNDLSAALNTTGPTTLEAGGGLTLSGTSTDAVSATAGDKVTLSDPAASILHITGATIGGTMSNPTPLDLTTTSTQDPITVNLAGGLPFLAFAGDIKTQIRSLGLYNGAVVMGSEMDHYNAAINLRAATTALAVNDERFGAMGMLAHSDDFFNTAPMESKIDSKGAFITPEAEPTLVDR